LKSKGGDSEKGAGNQDEKVRSMELFDLADGAGTDEFYTEGKDD
jgi:hypothetical protein